MIFLIEGNLQETDEVARALFDDLCCLDPPNAKFSLSPAYSSSPKDFLTKGDPITGYTIILSLIGAGGALSIAVGKSGFLTRLAEVLQGYIKREVKITVKTAKGTSWALSGPPHAVRKMLEEAFKHES